MYLFILFIHQEAVEIMGHLCFHRLNIPYFPFKSIEWTAD